MLLSTCWRSLNKRLLKTADNLEGGVTVRKWKFLCLSPSGPAGGGLENLSWSEAAASLVMITGEQNQDYRDPDQNERQVQMGGKPELSGTMTGSKQIFITSITTQSSFSVTRLPMKQDHVTCAAG